jgi:hypothetical protein
VRKKNIIFVDMILLIKLCPQENFAKKSERMTDKEINFMGKLNPLELTKKYLNPSNIAIVMTTARRMTIISFGRKLAL